MAKNYPQALADYIAAKNVNDPAAIAQCFAPDAIVHDENADIVGRHAIAAWAADTIQKYRFTMDVLDWKPAADGGVMTARLEGNFPGSPIELDYQMTFKDGKIASLKIE